MVEKGKGKIMKVCMQIALFRKNKALLKSVYGLVHETCKHNDTIMKVLAASKLLERETLNPFVAKTALEDLLYKRRLRSAGKTKEIVYKHKKELQRLFRELQPEKQDDVFAQMPAYLRINTIKTTKNDVIDHFVSKGYVFLDQASGKDLGENQKTFMFDKDIKNLLVFPVKIDLSDDHLYKEGHVIFQDKASCFPAIALSPRPGCTVIDACSSPGNKASHLVAIMKGSGKLVAIEKDKKRFTILKKRLVAAGIRNATLIEDDFLAIKPDGPYGDAEAILVDPSCSGSGMITTPEHLVLKKTSSEKFKHLIKMQKKLVNHALSFPKVQRVVYSTCSLNEDENEKVVQSVLRKNPSFELKKVLPRWKRRGLPKYSFSDMVARTDPKKDKTSGFFIALFQRK
eukprot:GHVN01038120.1.p1 GENE.GHVN01038120.1~~GHVN01038120.1.p1  ORF type:complete len:437 (+),score=38.95 GHVN01038120.1:115-1311(+)